MATDNDLANETKAALRELVHRKQTGKPSLPATTTPAGDDPLQRKARLEMSYALGVEPGQVTTAQIDSYITRLVKMRDMI